MKILDEMLDADKTVLVSEIKEKYQSFKDERTPHEKIWQQNLAFLLGKHWLKWDSVSNTYSDVTQNNTLLKKRKNSIRLTSNLILPGFRLLHAKLAKIKPILNVVPERSMDERNISAAQVGDVVLKAIWRDLKMQQILQYRDILRLCFGYAFLEPYLNVEKGDVVDEEGVRTGEVDCDVLSPFDVYLPKVELNSGINCLIKAKIRSVDYINQKYDADVKEDMELEVSSVQNQINALMGKSELVKPKGRALLLEYWEEESKSYPDGRLVAIANERLLSNDVIPPEYKGRIGIRKFDFFQVPLSIYTQGCVEQAISPQKEYNYSISNIVEFMKRMTKGKIKVPTGAQMITEYDDENGQILKFNPQGGQGPEQMPLASIPGYVFRDLQRKKIDLQDIIGMHDVSMAKPPKGVKSGKAIFFLQEQDDTQLGPILARDEEELAVVGEMFLDIVEKYYTEPRLLSTVGLNLSYEAKQFLSTWGKDEYDSSDIVMTKGGRRVIVQLGSGLPLSKGARDEYIMNLWNMGIIQDPDQFMKLIDLGEITQEFKSIDILAAETENQEMAKGIIHTVHNYDNHQVHIKVLNDFRKRPSFEKFPAATKNLFETHAKGHQEAFKKELENLKASGVQPPAGGGGGMQPQGGGGKRKPKMPGMGGM